MKNLKQEIVIMVSCITCCSVLRLLFEIIHIGCQATKVYIQKYNNSDMRKIIPEYSNSDTISDMMVSCNEFQIKCGNFHGKIHEQVAQGSSVKQVSPEHKIYIPTIEELCEFDRKYLDMCNVISEFKSYVENLRRKD